MAAREARVKIPATTAGVTQQLSKGKYDFIASTSFWRANRNHLSVRCRGETIFIVSDCVVFRMNGELTKQYNSGDDE